MIDPTGKYLVLWKGAQSGPFTLDEIQSRLRASEISRMHQIHANGAWQLLDEFLLKLRADEMEARRKEDRRREHSARETQRLAVHGGHSSPGGERSAEDANHEDQIHDRAHSSRERGRGAHRSARRLGADDESGDGDLDSDEEVRTSGLGVASFVVAIFSFVITVAAGVALSSQISAPALAICNLVPFLDIVAWIVALTFGHMAMRQTSDDESLRGRHLAIAGLIITYFLLVVGLTVVFLMFINHQKFP